MDSSLGSTVPGLSAAELGVGAPGEATELDVATDSAAAAQLLVRFSITSWLTFHSLSPCR